LEIPLALKLILKPANNFLIEPYTGIHFNIPLKYTVKYEITSENEIIDFDFHVPLCSWMIGFTYGIKAGPGIIYFDPRFSMDIGKSSINITFDSDLVNTLYHQPYQRSIIHIGIGYRIGVLSKSGRNGS
jgi:hypothetical protein